MPVLDVGEDCVLRLIEEGKVRWAFNLALLPGRNKKLLLIFPPCLADYMAGRECETKFEQVAERLTGGERQVLSAHSCYTALNVSLTHFYHLVRAGEIKAVSAWNSGPNGSARICARSFVKFLMRRAWPVAVTEAF